MNLREFLDSASGQAFLHPTDQMCYDGRTCRLSDTAHECIAALASIRSVVDALGPRHTLEDAAIALNSVHRILGGIPVEAR